MRQTKSSTLGQLVVLAFLLVLLMNVCFAQLDARREINIPDIPGYKTLKCDFHIHTVFSDGNVWPSVRPREAWLEGLDAIAMTEHVEYLPHKDDLTTDLNRSFEIAKPLAETRNLIIIRGAEITRPMPPGHFNTLFIKDANLLRTEHWMDAIKAAHAQGAFIVWNHPGWVGQEPDGISKWYDEHTELLNNGLMHAIEFVNEYDYYPEAHQWCIDKNLTMMGFSDIHDPISMAYQISAGKHRPMTLVFASEQTEESIREALIAGRTAVYNNDFLFGKAQFLKPIFENSIILKQSALNLKGKQRSYIQINNCSDIPFELVLAQSPDDIEVPAKVTFPADRTILFGIRAKKDDLYGKKIYDLEYIVKNLKITPDKGLPITLKLSIDFAK